MRGAAIFWGSAAGAAGIFALSAALLLPYEALRLDTEAERVRAWLLTLWSGGVMAILFGIAALLGLGGSLGYREVREAGGVPAALEARRAARAGRGPGRGGLAGWLVFAGASLIVLYFAAWLALGRV